MKSSHWRFVLLVIIPAFLIGGLCVSIVLDIKSNNEIVKIPRENPEEIGNINQVLYSLINGEDYDSILLSNVCRFIDGRYDCIDFRTPSLMHILYRYPDSLRPDDLNLLKQTVLNFKYWMIDPGEDSICFWSENHQILFAAAEYLAGHLYPDEVFTNTGMTGRQHARRGRERILIWLKQRWDYGYIEWHSHYYKEDIGALAVLVDFAADEEIRIKSEIILDLLMYDIASQSYKGNFSTTTGRAYESKRMSGLSSSLKSEIEHFFEYDVDQAENETIDMGLNLRYSQEYVMPAVFYEIARDDETHIIKGSTGLDLNELDALGLIGQDDEQIMMQWGMESFSNAPVIMNSIKYIENNHLFQNSDLYAFKEINLSFLKKFNLLPLASRIVKPQTNGVSIQRANTYMFRTPGYSMYTAQNYHPGEYGDQHHVAGMTLSNELSIFHNHPAVGPEESGVNGNSPTYWVGYGHLPHSVQYQNVNLSIYSLPKRKGMMEKELLDYTHGYFPAGLFDESSIENRFAFGRSGDTYAAFITPGNLSYRRYVEVHYLGGSDFDLLLPGRDVYWITEASDVLQDGSYEAFKERIRSQADTIQFNGKTLTYTSSGKTMELEFGGDFLIDDRLENLQYDRYDSPYIRSKRTPDELTFSWNGKKLHLNFDQQVREFN